MEPTRDPLGANNPTMRNPANAGVGNPLHAPSGRTGTLNHPTTERTDGNDTASATNPREQIETKLNDAMGRAANGLETAARRLDEMAGRRTEGASGTTARAGAYAHTAAEGMQGVANYLRDNDVRGLQGDLEKQVRERPLQSLLVAVAAGWLVGKILR